MKPRLLIFCAGLLLGTNTNAAVFTYSPSSPVGIPDGSPAGLSTSFQASGLYSSITDFSVTLNISGGYNGDLYAYVSHGGVLVPLVNRVGVTATGGGNSFGYGNSGFNVTLRSGALSDIHFYQSGSHTLNGDGQLTGTWQPDGRAIDPLSSRGTFDSPPGGRVTFDSYISNTQVPSAANPNGAWTLFFADLSSGATSQLVGWQLSVTEAPEPVNVALMVFGGAFGLVTLVRNRKVRNLFRRVEAN